MIKQSEKKKLIIIKICLLYGEREIERKSDVERQREKEEKCIALYNNANITT